MVNHPQILRSFLTTTVVFCTIAGLFLRLRRNRQIQEQPAAISQEVIPQKLATVPLNTTWQPIVIQQQSKTINKAPTSSPPSLLELFVSGDLNDLFATDPESLGEWIATLPKDQEQIALWDRFLNKWAKLDFDAALAWSKTLAPCPLQERALLHLSYQWEERDAVKLLDFALTLPEGNDRLIIALSNRWAKNQPREIADWAARLPDTPRKSKILSSLVASWAKTDPASALDFLSANPATPPFHEAHISAISALSIQAPELASSLVQGLPTGRLRDKAIENLAYYWSRKDPQATLDWIDASLSGKERDLAAIAGVGASIESDPKLSTLWANSISKQQLRYSQLSRSLTEWIKREPRTAKDWILQSDLPTQWTAQLLR